MFDTRPANRPNELSSVTGNAIKVDKIREDRHVTLAKFKISFPSNTDSMYANIISVLFSIWACRTVNNPMEIFVNNVPKQNKNEDIKNRESNSGVLLDLDVDL